MNLCKYKDIFGKKNEGLHSIRIFDIAIVDVLLTIFVAFLVSYFFKLNFIYSLVGLFIVGIFSHRFFCVRTTIDKLLFNK